jgi:RNA polymerase sigma-70 factor (ECF subfamily)
LRFDASIFADRDASSMPLALSVNRVDSVKSALLPDTGVASHRASEARVQTPITLAELFDVHYASIWRLLRRLGVPVSQVDDSAQEVFWVAARRLSDIEGGREHAFLYGVALRVASNWHRATKSAPPLDSELLEVLRDAGPNPEQVAVEREARALLDAALDQLPLELRTVLVLFELEGLPVKDIAELEGLPVGTAASRLRRAREEFSLVAKRMRALLESGRPL